MKKKEFWFSEKNYYKLVQLQKQINATLMTDYYSLSDVVNALLYELEKHKPYAIDIITCIKAERVRKEDSMPVHKVLLIADDESILLGKTKKELNSKRDDDVEIITTSDVVQFALSNYAKEVLKSFQK